MNFLFDTATDIKTIDNSSKSDKLIEVNDSKLILNSAINNISNHKIISIIGDARKGKSTFLNCIINYLTNDNIEYFKVQSSLQHCTIGMDYLKISIKDQEYIFIDCQGLNYEKSSEDSKYLLFLYSISNVIIFNDMNIINNNIFTTLQPMALFVNNFEELRDNNCVLYIRIADYDLDEDSSHLKNKLFTLQDDQYDNVRKSILKLFNEIYICNTLSLDREEKKYLKNNKYNSILSNNDNKFKIIISDIINKVNTLKPMTINLKKLVKYINSNKKIDHKKLDVYTLYTEKEINEFIIENFYSNNDLDFITFDEIKQPFSIDGLEMTRNKLLKIKEQLSNIKTHFNNSFTKVPKNLKQKFYNKYNSYQEFIDTLIKKNYDLAINSIEPGYEILNTNLLDCIVELDLFQQNELPDLCSDLIKKFIESYDLFDIKAFKSISLEINKKINNYEYLIIKCYNHNQLKLREIKTKFDSIQFNVKDIINKMKLNDGNFKKFIISNNPYQELILDNVMFKYIDKENTKNIKIFEGTFENIIEQFEQEYLDKFINLSLKFEDEYVKKLKELLSNTYFEELPLVKHKDIYFVKITLLSKPVKPIDVWVELDYLHKCIGVSDRVFNYYSKYYKNKSNEIDWTLIKQITKQDNVIKTPVKTTSINPSAFKETKIPGFTINVPFENPIINKWLIDLQIRLFDDETIFSKRREDIDRLIDN